MRSLELRAPLRLLLRSAPRGVSGATSTLGANALVLLKGKIVAKWRRWMLTGSVLMFSGVAVLLARMANDWPAGVLLVPLAAFAAGLICMWRAFRLQRGD